MHFRRSALVVLLQMSGLLLTDVALSADYARFTQAGCLLPRRTTPSWMSPSSYRIIANRIEGIDQETISAIGDVAFFQGDRTITTPRMDYSIDDRLIDAAGPVCFSNPVLQLEGSQLQYQHESETGFMLDPVYRMEIDKNLSRQVDQAVARGYGEKILFEGKDKYRLLGCRFTTCEGDDPDWYILADDISIDRQTMTAEARHARIYFKDTPILGLPWMDFPLDNRRRSGFLAPYVSINNRTGVSAGLPYYWNIAPNYDATITPIISNRRGVKVDTEFRYLVSNMQGTASLDYVPYDLSTKDDRYAFFWENRYTNIDYRVNARIKYNSVSDLEYFSDYSNRIQQMTRSILPREIDVDYFLPVDWAMGRINLLVQRFQVLDPKIGHPYERTPQLSFELISENNPWVEWAAVGEYARFAHQDLGDGQRAVLHPTVSIPLNLHSGVSVMPKVGMNVRHYDLSEHVDGKSTETIYTPMVSVDAKAIFERTFSSVSGDMFHTIEPRIFYLYVPNRNQSHIPLFDTGLMDVNFASIFSENRYSGHDRIADANDLTYGLTSRIIDAEEGTELLSGTVAQRIYFDQQHVGLPGESLRSDRRSDLLVGLNGLITPNFTINTLLQYGVSDAKFRQILFGLQYHPEPGKTLSVGQRYSEDQYNQLELAGQWPVSRKMRLVGRYSYSFRENRGVETLFGLEYDKDCWIFRLVGQRIQTVIGTPTTSLFMQLELTGLGGLGSNPTKLLRRSIPGYQHLNDIKAHSRYERNY